MHDVDEALKFLRKYLKNFSEELFLGKFFLKLHDGFITNGFNLIISNFFNFANFKNYFLMKKKPTKR